MDARRGSEAGTPGTAALGFAVKTIPRQSRRRNAVCSWRSLRAPGLYAHVAVAQEQLLMRAQNTAHFSNADAAEFYLSVAWWVCFVFTETERNDAVCPVHQERSPLIIIGYNSGINLVWFIYWKILSLVNQFWKLEVQDFHTITFSS